MRKKNTKRGGTRKLVPAQRMKIYRLMQSIDRLKEQIERVFDRAGVSAGQAKRSEQRNRIWRERGR
jgi:hypothetical protein